MHLLQNYSFQLGQYIDKIHTYEKYYPLPFDNYIVIQPWSKPAKNYDNWDEVLSILFPILDKAGIRIIQVGGPNEPALRWCHHTQGTTSLNQLQYIVSKAKLVLSTDSISAHLAGHYNLPLVTLISNNYSDCVKPYFGDKNKHIILEPDRSDKKPSFQLDEPHPKQINEVKPELIAESVCKLLNLEYKYEYKTLNIGKNYHTKIVESACDNVINPQQIGIPNIIIRLDYNFNLAVLIQQLQLCKCSIVTNKPIPINILNDLKTNIIEVIYKIEEDNNPNFCKELQENKIAYRLFTDLSEDKLNKIKFKYIDYNVIIKREYSKPKILDNCKIEDIYYKSSKITIGRNKIYQSKWAYTNDISIPNFDIFPQKLEEKNIDLLFEEEDYILLLEKIDKIK